MKQILLFFTLFSLSLITPLFTKGYGHGGGGHGGGHSGGGHAHARSGNARSGVGSTNSGSAHAATKVSKTKTIITRSTSPTVIAANHGRNMRPNITNPHAVVVPRNGAPVGAASVPEYNGYYYNPYYAYPYYAYPYFYNPYFSMWSFGAMFMYTPNYYPVSEPQYANSTNNDQLSKQPMDGFVVFYNDTLSGAVTVATRAISLETTDSGKDYDYRFREKDPGLQCVTVYNDDDKQISLTRLRGDKKKLWRIVHEGKLNVYDSRRGFIYQPEDIDVKTLTVSYNGVVAALHSSSIKDTKEWLTQYVNQAYGTALDPKKFSWKELLIYLDKLD